MALESARRSLFRQILIRFSVLILILLLLVSAVCFFLFRGLSLQAGVSQAQTLSSLLLVGRFILILIFVILVAAILLGLIFLHGFKLALIELTSQIAGLKTLPPGARVSVNDNLEVGDLALAVNQFVDRFEKEISRDLQAVEDERRHFIDEQSKVGFEQKKIYEEKEKLEYILTRINDGVILLSKNKNIVLLNKAAEEMIGYKQYESGGRPVRSIIKLFEGDREIMPEEYAPAARTGALKDEAFMKKQVRIESSQATSKFADLVCVRLTLIQTQDLGYMIVLHDLTARLEIEKKRTALLTSFARELKQPLNSVSGNLNSGNINLAGASSALARLSCIMDNLLTVSALEEGKFSLASGRLDLIEIVKNCLSILSPLAGERQISLSFVPPVDFPAQADAGAGAIKQIVLNLLYNALYFTLPGGTVSISFSHSERDIILQIQDTGIGIKPEFIKDLFVKFSIAENDRGIETGIGLGLYLCKKLIELQGGKIWLDSVEGRGTVASISLPKASQI